MADTEQKIPKQTEELDEILAEMRKDEHSKKYADRIEKVVNEEIKSAVARASISAPDISGDISAAQSVANGVYDATRGVVSQSYGDSPNLWNMMNSVFNVMNKVQTGFNSVATTMTNMQNDLNNSINSARQAAEDAVASARRAASEALSNATNAINSSLAGIGDRIKNIEDSMPPVVPPVVP